MNADECFNKLLSDYAFDTVLDIGSGEGEHTKAFKQAGKTVTSVSLIPPADIVGDYLTVCTGKFDALWACHVLEHQPNVNMFLKKCFADLKTGGVFAVTVPPLKHEIVGGHVSLWNAGLLLYNLILAGFDCKRASVKTYGYNISVIVRKKKANLPRLIMDFGDIEALKEFFPLNVVNGFNGDIGELHWSTKLQ